MHRDSIEPGVISDTMTISPRGGSSGRSSADRLVNQNRSELFELRSLINDLLNRVKALENRGIEKEEETDYSELIRQLDARYVVKESTDLQRVTSRVLFSGTITFSGPVLFSGPFNLPYGWSTVCSSTAIWIYKNNNLAVQVA